MRPSALPKAAAAALVGLALAGALASAGEPKRYRADVRGRSPEYIQAIQSLDAMRIAKPAPSESKGTVSNGSLENAAELPAKGFGYRLADGKRKTHFGSDMMVYGLIEVAALMQERHPKTPWMSIGDIAQEKGGKLSPHINHQDGLDADVAFLYCNDEGQPVDKGWLKCDAEGKAKGARFDAARSFEMLDLYVTSPYTGGCEWILCFDPIKKILVDHGRKQAQALARSKKTVAEAERLSKVTDELEKLLRQPESSPHDDHFHIRVNKKHPELPAPGPPEKPKKAAKPDPKKADPKNPAGPKEPEAPEEPKKPEGDGGDEGAGKSEADGEDEGGYTPPPGGGDEDD